MSKHVKAVYADAYGVGEGIEDGRYHVAVVQRSPDKGMPVATLLRPLTALRFAFVMTRLAIKGLLFKK